MEENGQVYADFGEAPAADRKRFEAAEQLAAERQEALQDKLEALHVREEAQT